MKEKFAQLWSSIKESAVRGFLLVLLFSGCGGFLIAVIGHKDWQVAVETAQVVAGIVDYPKGNPFYVYHTKLWTITHQICAIFLQLGVSESTLSWIISGVLGMVSYQALAVCVYALSRSVLLSIGAPFLIHLTHITDFGVTYPIWLMGFTHTYGVLGLAYTLLVVGVFGSGFFRTGLFLLALAPAIHPSLGLWLGLIMLLCILLDYKNLRQPLWKARNGFVLGCCITGASLLFQLLVTYDVPKADPAVTKKYFAAFTAFWDAHRQPVGVNVPQTASLVLNVLDLKARDDFHQAIGIGMNLLLILIGIFWHTAYRRDLGPDAKLLLRVLAIAGALAIGAVYLSRVPPDKIPKYLLILMPSRILNLDILACAAVLFGLAAFYKKNLWFGIYLLLFMAALLMNYRSFFWPYFLLQKGIQPEEKHIFLINPLNVLRHSAYILLISVGLLKLYHRFLAPILKEQKAASTKSKDKKASQTSESPPKKPVYEYLSWIPQIGAVLVLAGVVWMNFSIHFKIRKERNFVYEDYRTREIFSRSSQGKGILLTGGDLHLIQLWTRRPVLLDGGGLDGLAYSLEAGPEMDRILREVYGVDMFHPPPEAYGTGSIPPQYTRSVWEPRTLEEWKQIRETYNVTEVLTRADWNLQLPEILRDNEYALFSIPE